MITWATRSDHDVDDHGHSWSTHPADLAAELLARTDAPDEHRQAAATSSQRVREVITRLDAELLELGLLRTPAPTEELPWTRWYTLDGHRLITSQRQREITDCERQEQATLAALYAAPMLGPEPPPRDLPGARLLYEPRGLDLTRGIVSGEISTLRQLDRAIATYARCSERTARTTRINVWRSRGGAGRPRKKILDSVNWANNSEGARDSCAPPPG